IDFIELFAEDHDLGDNMLDRLRLVGSEAITNAIEHGNELDPSKLVTFVLAVNEQFVEMLVTDEGPGFDESKLPDPLARENLLAEGGRGVYLIHQFADEIRYESNGNCLCARFALS
ncbi:MAG TPA: ATP-binding protein, partial [Rhodothermales bacterium]|nr:ATP-binding protein [Rhodothermales bacterium]